MSCLTCQRVRKAQTDLLGDLMGLPTDEPIPLELRYRIRQVYELTFFNIMKVQEEQMASGDRYKEG